MLGACAWQVRRCPAPSQTRVRGPGAQRGEGSRNRRGRAYRSAVCRTIARLRVRCSDHAASGCLGLHGTAPHPARHLVFYRHSMSARIGSAAATRRCRASLSPSAGRGATRPSAVTSVVRCTVRDAVRSFEMALSQRGDTTMGKAMRPPSQRMPFRRSPHATAGRRFQAT